MQSFLLKGFQSNLNFFNTKLKLLLFVAPIPKQLLGSSKGCLEKNARGQKETEYQAGCMPHLPPTLLLCLSQISLTFRQRKASFLIQSTPPWTPTEEPWLPPPPDPLKPSVEKLQLLQRERRMKINTYIVWGFWLNATWDSLSYSWHLTSSLKALRTFSLNLCVSESIFHWSSTSPLLLLSKKGGESEKRGRNHSSTNFPQRWS